MANEKMRMIMRSSILLQILYLFLTQLLIFRAAEASESMKFETFRSWRTLHIASHIGDQKLGYKQRVIDANAFSSRFEYKHFESKARSKRSAASDDNKADPKHWTNIAALNDSHTTLVVHWAGEGSDVIWALAKHGDSNSSAVFVSRDYGKSFTDVSSRMMVTLEEKAVIEQFYTLKDSINHYVLADVIHKCIFITGNSGLDFQRHCNLPFVPRTLKLNSENPQEILGMDDEEGRMNELYITRNGGLTWDPLFTRVKTFYWGIPPYHSASTIFVVEEQGNGKRHVLQAESGGQGRTTTIFDDVIDFEIRDDYMFATKSVHLLGSAYSRTLQLWVSHQKGNFVRAEFPSNHNFTDFYVADASEGQLMVCATVNSSHANLYVSEAQGFLFSLSLERIVYFNPKTGYSQKSWFRFYSNETFVDLTKISGVSGIYIASQSLGDTLSLENQRTLITYDKGGQWEVIATPKFTIGDRPSDCMTRKPQSSTSRSQENNCSLHLTQEFSRLYPGNQAYPILSQDSAPGMVIASGVMGVNLKGDPDVFVSSNAGIEWRQVLSGSYLYATGDHGGIIVAVQQFVEVDSVVFSIDEGENWESYKITKDKIRVYGLLTEPGENTTIFSVFGSPSTHHSWHIIQVNFTNAFRGKCAASDYKDWIITEDLPIEDGCLLGHVTKYQRRIAHALCYNGDDFVRQTTLSNCSCTREDFECDFGFEERMGTNICVPDGSTPDAEVHAVPVPCLPGTFYQYTRGYRKVAGDTCSGGQEHRYGPLLYSCPVQERAEFLLLTQENEISMVDLASGEITQLLHDRVSHIPAVFDYKDNCVIFIDNSGYIKKQCFEDHESSTTVHEVIRPHINGTNVDSMAFDWTGRNIYFADERKGTITVVNVDGRFERQLYSVQNGVYRPGAIVLNPAIGYLYLVGADSGSGSNFNIYQAAMDGSDRTVKLIANSSVVTEGTQMSLDLASEQLYWVSPGHSRMYSMDIKNGSVHSVGQAQDIFQRVTGVGLYKNWLYVSSQYASSIFMTHKLRLSDWESFVSIHMVFGMEVVSNYSHQAVSACSPFHSRCSQLCLPCPAKGSETYNRKCLCGNGYGRIKQAGSQDEQCMCEHGEVMQINGTCVAANNTTQCSSEKFTCANHRCVMATWRCDGDDDCGDGSDEVDCQYTTCGNQSFTCHSGKCIPKQWQCDREDDCRDGWSSDELNCGAINCTANQFRCDNGYCINEKWRCDMDDDCHDNSDERDCGGKSATCPPWQFTCNSGQCIDSIFKCDGRFDCGDRSDESNCTTSSCSSVWQFDCGNGHCIFETWKCDGDTDCSNGKDEENCTSPATPSAHNVTCGPNYKTCNNGFCVGWEDICNGVDDCGDNSDERGCFYSTTTTTELPSRCMHYEFYCKADKRCLPRSKKCDGHEDCSDGKDEENCVDTCRFDQYQCARTHGVGGQGKCIWIDWVCDGEPDCPLEDDEDYCKGSTGCSNAEFECTTSGGCLPWAKHCDVNVDCADGSDEIGCNYTHPVNCSHFNNHREACCAATGCRVFVPSSYQSVDGHCQSGTQAEVFKDLNACEGSISGDYTCKSSQVKCQDIRMSCVSFVQVCDGHADCGNDQDESGCDEIGCNIGGDCSVSVIEIGSTSISFEPLSNLDMVSFAEMVTGTPVANLTWRNKTVTDWRQKKPVQIGSLKPATQHMFVFFRNSSMIGRHCVCGKYERSTLEGLPTAPTHVASSLHIENFPLTYGVDILWRAPDSPNGQISAYVIYHQEVDNSGKSLSDVYSNLIDADDAERTNGIDYKVTIMEGIQAKKTYDFWVAAVNSAGTGQISVKKRQTIGQVPQTDLNVKVANKTETSLTLSWTKDTGAAGYKVTLRFAETNLNFPAARLESIVKDVESSQTNITIDGICPHSLIYVTVQSVYDQKQLGPLWYPSGSELVEGQVQMPGQQPVVRITSIQKTDSTSVLVKYSSAVGTGKQFYIYYTHDKTKKPLNHTARELAHEIHGLLACENYFLWIRPDYPTCPYQDLKDFITGEDLRAPPKDLSASINRTDGQYSMILRWHASCYQLNMSLSYIVCLQADNQQHSEDIKTPEFTGVTGLNLTIPYVKEGQTYMVTVRANVPGAQESRPISIVIPSLDGPYNIVVQHLSALNVSVRWEWYPQYAKSDDFKEFVVKTSGEGVSFHNHTSKFELRLSLPHDGRYIFTVEVKSKSDEVIADSEPVSFSFEGQVSHTDDSISITKTNLVAILVPVAVVVVGLSAGLVFYIVRHKRLQRSFLAFANSHYNIQSGTTTFSEDLDGDEPMIQGFSDDEPLVIA